MNVSVHASHIRRFILLTLSHAERADRQIYTPHFVVSKICGLFSCDQVIVAKELRADGGYHYHVGILNSSASANTATRLLREAFSEFGGHQLNVSFHRSWKTILKYCLKTSPDLYCWNTSVEECLRHAGRAGTSLVAQTSSRSNKRLKSSSISISRSIVSRLVSYDTWEEAIRDEELLSEIAPRIASYKQTFYEYKGAVAQNPEPFVDRLNAKVELLLSYEGKVLRYTPEELGKNIYSILEWLAENLSTDRQGGAPQLFIVGETALGKTRLFKLLEESEVCNFFPMDELLEFSGASNFVDAFIFDEFSLDMSNLSSKLRVINEISDGQKVKLNVKYSCFLKTKNLGVIIISSDYPRYVGRVSKGSFDAFLRRFRLVEFDRKVNWDSRRLLLTLNHLVDKVLIKHLAGAPKISSEYKKK